MSSRTSSRSTLTMVPSTMSPSLKYLIVLSIAARKSSAEPMSLIATVGTDVVASGAGETVVVDVMKEGVSKCLVAARCSDPFAGERAEPPLPRGTVDERETCMTSVACSRSRHADPATRFTEYGTTTIRVNAAPVFRGLWGFQQQVCWKWREPLARLSRCGASDSLRGRNAMDADVVVVGAGLAGLVASPPSSLKAGPLLAISSSTRRAGPPRWAGRRSGRSAG